MDSTLAVATVLHVPALYWHQDDGPPPSPSYTNYKQLVDTLNLKIEAFNIENGASSAPKLHQTGERSLAKGKKRKFQFQAFREEKKEDTMHLKDDKRFKMAKCLVKYFTKATAKWLSPCSIWTSLTLHSYAEQQEVVWGPAYRFDCLLPTTALAKIIFFDCSLPTTALAKYLVILIA